MNSTIENLNQFGGQFLKFAWPMFWQSSLLIAVVFLADVLLARKIRAAVRHALWLVVLAKLLLPPTLALPTGAAWWLFPVKPVVIPAARPPEATHYSVMVDDAPLPADFVPEPIQRIEPPKPQLTGAGWILVGSSVVSLGLLGWLVFRWGQLARKVRGAAKVFGNASPENIADAVERARQGAGLRAGVRLKLVEGNLSPAVCGLFRPVILLPRLLVDTLSAAQLQAVLLHEMIHLRRGDIWVNCAQSLLQIFYWWHPLVWLANARMRRVREEAVDDAVMLALAEDAEHYAPTLLEVAKLAFRRPLMSLGLVGIMESRSALRQRIERLMDFRAPRRAGLTVVSVCGIFMFSAVAVPMGRGQARAPKEPASHVQATANSTDTVLVGDTFTNLSGARIARLNTDGSLDLNFTNFDNALFALKQSAGIENLRESQTTTLTGRDENRGGIYPAQTLAVNEAAPAGNLPPSFTKTIVPNSTSNSIGRTTDTPRVLISGEFYQISSGDFASLTSGIQFTRGTTEQCEWWSGADDEFSKIHDGLKANPPIPPITPCTMTLSGRPAQLYMQDAKNLMELDCLPVANGTNVDLNISGKLVSRQAGMSVTNEFEMDAPVQSHGGMIIRIQTANGAGVSNIVVWLTATIPPPQLHIKARFISVPRGTMSGMENLANTQNLANGEIAGILNNTNLMVVLQALRSRKGVEILGEQEVTMLSKRQAQIRTTEITTVVTNMMYNESISVSVAPQTAAYELGTILDVNANVLADGYTIHLKAAPALTEFLGYQEMSESAATSGGTSQAAKWSKISPVLQTQTLKVEANLRDNRTLVLCGLMSRTRQSQSDSKARDALQMRGRLSANTTFVTNDVLVFITATIVDAAGNRVHANDDLAPGEPEIPEQPATTNSGVEISVPLPTQLPGHAAAPSRDSGQIDRLLVEGKKLYENAMLNEAKTKFLEVLHREPGNATAMGYLDSIEQMSGAIPVRHAIAIPSSNPYATNHLTFTGPGRQVIVKKLDKIHLDTFSCGATLNEVLKHLSEDCRSRDPEGKGINFLINNNFDGFPSQASSANGGNGPNLDPVMGLLTSQAATPDQPDVGSYMIRISNLSDVRVTDVLDAITLVSDHPLKYSIQDFAVVFSARGTDQLFMRTFRVDPNIFYSGLENVSAQSFGAVQGGGASGGGRSQNNGAVVGVVNAFPGASSVRGAGGGDKSEQSLQGSSYHADGNVAPTPSAAARTYFSKLGVNLNDPPGKSVFYNDKLGYLFVKATESDLNTIERGLQVANQTPPQIHIKARFYEVPKGTFSGNGYMSGKATGDNETNLMAATFTSILTDPNFHVTLRDLSGRTGVKVLGEPEITTISGRETHIRIIKSAEDRNSDKDAINTQTNLDATILDLDVIPYVLADGHIINLAVIPSGSIHQLVSNANVWDNQTLLLKLTENSVDKSNQLSRTKADREIVIFVTTTIVDATGNRVHSDDELPSAQTGIPPQPKEVDKVILDKREF